MESTGTKQVTGNLFSSLLITDWSYTISDMHMHAN